MARSLLSAVEAALASANGPSMVDVVRADFGNGRTFRWATVKLPDEHAGSFDGERYDVRLAQGSRLGLQKMKWSSGGKGDKLTLALSNHDRLFTKLSSQGVVFDGASLSICRLFPTLAPPNNAIGTWTNPLWQGHVAGAVIEEDVCTLDVQFGPIELTRRALRRYTHTCDALFADGEQCPYAPLIGFGLPEPIASGSATGGTAWTIVDSTADFAALGVLPGWSIFVPGKRLCSRVYTVSGDTISIAIGWYADGALTAAVPENGDSYVIGPDYLTCPGSQAACVIRGMFGINGTQTASDLNYCARRFFQGITRPTKNAYGGYSGKNVWHRRTGYYLRTPQGNDSLDGKPVPVVVGTMKLNDIDLLAWAPAGDFTHAFFVVGEGRIYDIQSSSYELSPHVDGLPPDVLDGDGDQESLVKFGTSAVGGDASAAELTTLQINQAIGSRQSQNTFKGTVSDTYASVPYLFNGADGEGLSLSGLAGFYIRTEPGQNQSNSEPAGQCEVTGILLPLCTGAAPDSLGMTGWTRVPTPIHVFYGFLVNRRWGAGMSEAQIDLAAVIAETAHCEVTIPSTQTSETWIAGAVFFGPNDCTRTGLGMSSNWIAYQGELPQRNAIGGAAIHIEAGGETLVNTVAGCTYYESLNEYAVSGMGLPESAIGQSVTIIYLFDQFDGTVPGTGATFEVRRDVFRAKANGVLEQDTDVAKMLDAIMDNVPGGTWIQSGGKLAPVIRKAVDYTTIESLPVITDYGSNRNVIRKSGKSTMKWTADKAEDICTSVDVEFCDAGLDYQKVRLTVVDARAQQRLAAIWGAGVRDKRSHAKSLNLTTSRDQALRIAAVYLREHGLLEIPGYQPGTLEWQMPIHDAMTLEVERDVRRIASKHIPSWIQYVRIKEIADNGDGTVSVKARPHYNGMYTDDAADIGWEERQDGDTPPSGDMPAACTIVSVTEAVITNPQTGQPTEQLTVVITLPQGS